MTFPTLLSIADRVEQLTGPCRETADEVLLACGWQIEDWGEGPARSRGWINPAADGEDYLDGDHPNPTASLDAAMTLRLDWMSVEMIESAPEPQFTRCRVWDWRRSPTMSDPGNEWKAEGNRPLPLNICSAILRARAALEVSRG